jgi:hypothetical protein
MITHTAQATNAIKWIDALKGGKRGYKKGIFSLGQKVNHNTNEPQSYCCLGVGCKVLNVKVDDWGVSYDETFTKLVGLYNNEGYLNNKVIDFNDCLTGINDFVYSGDKTFTNIRKFILKHLDDIFIPPVASKLKQHYGK